MQWTRSETLALASQRCTSCWGLGVCPGRQGTDRPCNCVFRAIFRACYARFGTCAVAEPYMACLSMERRGVASRGYSYKNQEYVADFVLLSQRILGRDTLAGRIFRYHFLQGADWKLCTRRLGIDRGEFFHEVYRVQQRLGRAYRETQPYGLFPLDEYFGGRVETGPRKVTPIDECAAFVPVRAPLLAA